MAWFRDLHVTERRTMVACFGGWSLDAFDVQIFSFVIPSLLVLWGITTALADDVLPHGDLHDGAFPQRCARRRARVLLQCRARHRGNLPGTGGFLASRLGLAAAIATFTFRGLSLMIVALLLLPETKGRSLESLDTQPAA